MNGDEKDGMALMLHKELTARIIQAFYITYNELGHGFLEHVYENALSITLTEAGLATERQVPIPVYFHGETVGEYKADLVVENAVILELKAVSQLSPVHVAQLRHYLRATTMEVGLLFNFGEKPEFRRLVFENSRKTSAKIRAFSAGIPAAKV